MGKREKKCKKISSVLWFMKCDNCYHENDDKDSSINTKQWDASCSNSISLMEFPILIAVTDQ